MEPADAQAPFGRAAQGMGYTRSVAVERLRVRAGSTTLLDANIPPASEPERDQDLAAELPRDAQLRPRPLL